MVETFEKSTAAVREKVHESDQETVFLDSRLALYGEKARWLAISDLHYGYEVRRRAEGGLWPMWGRETIESRVDDLVSSYQPKTLILNGDIVDGAISGQKEVIKWLFALKDRCDDLILIKGNHDKGALIREFDWLPHFEIGEWVFHHGHRDFAGKNGQIEVVGHIHPAYRYSDGAGLSMKLPSFVAGETKWVMPAFSPWAGGVRYACEKSAKQWACSLRRVFQVDCTGYSQ